MLGFREFATCGLIVAGSAIAASGETLHYYYVSGPVYVSNQEDPADRVLLNTGWLTVDRTKLPDNGSLANRTISVDYGDWPPRYDPAIEAVSHGFASAEGGGVDNLTITFDEDEMLSRWSFDNATYPSSGGVFVSISNRDDRVEEYSGYASIAEINARYVLENLGYMEGTPAYERLWCGEWAGPNASCGPIGEPADAWAAHQMAEGGMWFTDPIAYALQVEAVTRAALADPPRSYHDIAPVPVPAPLGLLLVGMGAIAFVRRRARG